YPPSPMYESWFLFLPAVPAPPIENPPIFAAAPPADDGAVKCRFCPTTPDGATGGGCICACCIPLSGGGPPIPARGPKPMGGAPPLPGGPDMAHGGLVDGRGAADEEESSSNAFTKSSYTAAVSASSRRRLASASA